MLETPCPRSCVKRRSGLPGGDRCAGHIRRCCQASVARWRAGRYRSPRSCRVGSCLLARVGRGGVGMGPAVRGRPANGGDWVCSTGCHCVPSQPCVRRKTEQNRRCLVARQGLNTKPHRTAAISLVSGCRWPLAVAGLVAALCLMSHSRRSPILAYSMLRCWRPARFGRFEPAC